MAARPDRPSRFFKVILPTSTVEHKLRFPSKFVEEYEHELANTVTLTDCTSGVWQVELEKAGQTLWLHRGRDDFFQDHSIRHGYFVLFEYIGESSFNVFTFDLSATEVRYPVIDSSDSEEAQMAGRQDLPARFFKVILPISTVQHKLRFPSKFVEAYKHELANTVTLTDCTGAMWQVDLEKVGESLWLHHGWGDFYHDHSISHGYFVTFEYIGESSFNVFIFDMSATEVGYPVTVSSNTEEADYFPWNPLPETGGSSDDDSVKILDAPPAPEVAYPLRSASPIQSVFQARRSKRKEHHQSSPGAKRGSRKTVSDPWFIVEMKANLAPQWVLYVPAQFARHYLERNQEEVRLYDADDEVWPTRVNIRDGLVRYLSWVEFARAKGIQVGDQCLFELVPSKPPALKVSKISTCKKTGAPINL